MLTTLAKLKDALGITDTAQDTLLNSCLSQANALIAGYIGADLSDTAEKGWTALLPAGANYLHLPVWPVIDITSMMVDGMIVTPAEYFLDKRTGVVFFNSITGADAGGSSVEYTLKAGYASVPVDLDMVCSNVAASIYKAGGNLAASAMGGTGELKSLTMFDAMSMSFDVGNASSSTGPEQLIGAWAFLLDKYRLTIPVVK